MLCEKYQSLTVPERTIAIGEIIHAFQNDDECFTAILDIVKDAKITGVFEGVVINPDKNKKNL